MAKEPLKNYTFRVSEEIREWIEGQDGGGPEYLRCLVAADMKRQTKRKPKVKAGDNCPNEDEAE